MSDPPKPFIREEGVSRYINWNDESPELRAARQKKVEDEYGVVMALNLSETGEQEELPGRTLLEHSFRSGLELEMAGAEKAFAKFGPWVGRTVAVTSTIKGEKGQEEVTPKTVNGVVIGWRPTSGEVQAAWKVKIGEGRAGVIELTFAGLQNALAQPAAVPGDKKGDGPSSPVVGGGSIPFAGKGGPAEWHRELEDLCEELDELIELTLERTKSNQLVWDRSSTCVTGWWPAELLSAAETRAICLLTPQLAEDWKDGRVLVRYFNGQTQSSSSEDEDEARSTRTKPKPRPITADGQIHQLSWAKYDKLRAFEEVSKTECMPSKTNKHRASIIRAMEHASERAASLQKFIAEEAAADSPTATTGKNGDGNGSAGATTLKAEVKEPRQSGRARREAKVPERFRESPSVKEAAKKKPYVLLTNNLSFGVFHGGSLRCCWAECARIERSWRKSAKRR